MSEPMHAKTSAELGRLSDAELVEQHDMLAKGTVIGVNYYLAELERRRADRQSRLMIRLTMVVTALTVVNMVVVIVSLA
jgi:hypothetical protein